jgi:hypothetical protein
MSITLSESVSVALGILHAMYESHISSVAYPALQYFSTLSHKWHDFPETVIEHTMCVSIFSTTFVGNIFNSKKKLATYD